MVDAETWTYYEMDEAKDNKLVGQGSYAGVELSLSHHPSNLKYGLQYGNNASLQNTGLGISVWIDIEGEVNGTNYYSKGDFNVALTDCDENPNFDNNCSKTIVRTWIATDACGNQATHTQTITVSDTTAPVIDCPEDEDFGLVTEAPTEFADKATWIDNCQGAGETTQFTDVLTETVGGDDEDGIIFTCAIDDITYVITFAASTGTDENGYNTYSNAPITVNGAPDDDGYRYNLIFNATANRWESFNVNLNVPVFF